MARARILVEGDTEETFVKQVLTPHLAAFNITIEFTINIQGIKKYSLVKKDIRRMLGDPTVALVTTLIDYYGLPKTFPGKNTITGQTAREKVEFLESQLEQNINDTRFRAYYSLHEFEALVFSDVEMAADELGLNTLARKKLRRIGRDYPNPEEINDGPATAPSKRLSTIYPKYGKTLHGIPILRKIGLDTIRANCPHFNDWLIALENLGRAP